MNLPEEIRGPLAQAAGAAVGMLFQQAEAVVSEATGRRVKISTGPVGQIVISPEETGKDPAPTFLHLALPLLLGSVAINLGRAKE